MRTERMPAVAETKRGRGRNVGCRWTVGGATCGWWLRRTSGEAKNADGDGDRDRGRRRRGWKRGGGGHGRKEKRM
uniref:Uncharacterized protein n=1 Tax=Cucumis melo TaxID=3656 RepID=A0A9I9E3J7_CUCME